MASSTSTAIEQEEAKGKNRAEEGINGRRIAAGEDDYKWKKYGKKYIKGIRKYRSYFRCVNKNCRVKKMVDWPPNEPNNTEIKYEGEHNHRNSENEEAAISANQYDLATQMFGSRT